jgi:hypothetical protein
VRASSLCRLDLSDQIAPQRRCMVVKKNGESVRLLRPLSHRPLGSSGRQQ